eukprot:PhM_4_TR2481/c0_g1_i1/m.33890
MSLYTAVTMVCAQYLSGSLAVLQDVLSPGSSSSSSTSGGGNAPNLVPSNIGPEDIASANYSIMDLIQVNGVSLADTLRQLFDLYMRAVITNLVRYMNLLPERRAAVLERRQEDQLQQRVLAAMQRHVSSLGESRQAQWLVERRSLHETVARLQGEVMFYQHKDREKSKKKLDSKAQSVDTILSPRVKEMGKKLVRSLGVVVLLDVDNVHVLWQAHDLRDDAAAAVHQYERLVAELAHTSEGLAGFHAFLSTTHVLFFVDVVSAMKFVVSLRHAVEDASRWPASISQRTPSLLMPRTLVHHIRADIPLPLTSDSFTTPIAANDMRSAAYMLCLVPPGEVNATFPCHDAPAVRRLCTFSLLEAFVTPFGCGVPLSLYAVTITAAPTPSTTTDSKGKGGTASTISNNANKRSPASTPPRVPSFHQSGGSSSHFTSGGNMAETSSLKSTLALLGKLERAMLTLNVGQHKPRPLPNAAAATVVTIQILHVSEILDRFDPVFTLAHDFLFLARRACERHEGTELVPDRTSVTEYPHGFVWTGVFERAESAFLACHDIVVDFASVQVPHELMNLLITRRLVDKYSPQVGVATGRVDYEIGHTSKPSSVPLLSLQQQQQQQQGGCVSTDGVYVTVHGEAFDQSLTMCRASAGGEVTLCPPTHALVANEDFFRRYPGVHFEPRGNVYTFSLEACERKENEAKADVETPVRPRPLLALPAMETHDITPNTYVYLSCYCFEGIQFMHEIDPDAALAAITQVMCVLHEVLGRTAGVVIDMDRQFGTVIVLHPNAGSAVECSLHVQHQLVTLTWPPDVLRFREAAELKINNDETVIFAGPRLQMGIACGADFVAVLSVATDLCESARGGDTLMPRSMLELVYHQLKKDMDDPWVQLVDVELRCHARLAEPVYRVLPAYMRPREAFIKERPCYEEDTVNRVRLVLERRFKVEFLGTTNRPTPEELREQEQGHEASATTRRVLDPKEASEAMKARALAVQFGSEATTQLLTTEVEEAAAKREEARKRRKEVDVEQTREALLLDRLVAEAQSDYGGVGGRMGGGGSGVLDENLAARLPFTATQYKTIVRCFQQTDSIESDLTVAFTDLEMIDGRVADMGIDVDPEPVTTAPDRIGFLEFMRHLYPTLQLGDLESVAKALGLPHVAKKTKQSAGMAKGKHPGGLAQQKDGNSAVIAAPVGANFARIKQLTADAEASARTSLQEAELSEIGLMQKIFKYKIFMCELEANNTVLARENDAMVIEVQRLQHLTEYSVSYDEFSAVKKVAAMEKEQLSTKVQRLLRSLLQVHYCAHLYSVFMQRFVGEYDNTMKEAQFIDEWVATMTSVVGDTLDPAGKIPQHVSLRMVSDADETASRATLKVFEGMVKPPGEFEEANADPSIVISSTLTVLISVIPSILALRDRCSDDKGSKKGFGRGGKRAALLSPKASSNNVKVTPSLAHAAVQCDLGGRRGHHHHGRDVSPPPSSQQTPSASTAVSPVPKITKPPSPPADDPPVDRDWLDGGVYREDSAASPAGSPRGRRGHHQHQHDDTARQQHDASGAASPRSNGNDVEDGAEVVASGDDESQTSSQRTSDAASDAFRVVDGETCQVCRHRAMEVYCGGCGDVGMCLPCLTWVHSMIPAPVYEHQKHFEAEDLMRGALRVGGARAAHQSRKHSFSLAHTPSLSAPYLPFVVLALRMVRAGIDHDVVCSVLGLTMHQLRSYLGKEYHHHHDHNVSDDSPAAVREFPPHPVSTSVSRQRHVPPPPLRTSEAYNVRSYVQHAMTDDSYLHLQGFAAPVIGGLDVSTVGLVTASQYNDVSVSSSNPTPRQQNISGGRVEEDLSAELQRVYHEKRHRDRIMALRKRPDAPSVLPVGAGLPGGGAARWKSPSRKTTPEPSGVSQQLSSSGTTASETARPSSACETRDVGGAKQRRPSASSIVKKKTSFLKTGKQKA